MASLCLPASSSGRFAPRPAISISEFQCPDPARWRSCVAQSDGSDRAFDGSAAAQADLRQSRTEAAAQHGGGHGPDVFGPAFLPPFQWRAGAVQWGFCGFRGPLLGVLRYDETSGSAFREMPHSHYQRLSAGNAVLIADTGPPPKGSVVAPAAHAGCLSFELSSGANRYIVNAGAPVVPDYPDYADFARMTAAHSTVTLDDSSSLKFSQSEFLGPIVTGGVRRSPSNRSTRVGASGFQRDPRWLCRYKLEAAAPPQDPAAGHPAMKCRAATRFSVPMKASPTQNRESDVAVARFHVHPSIRFPRTRTARCI
jgi:hypothetical protein